MMKAEKLIERQDAKNRNAVESEFGEGKRKYGLNRIVAKLKETVRKCYRAAIHNDELGA